MAKALFERLLKDTFEQSYTVGNPAIRCIGQIARAGDGGELDLERVRALSKMSPRATGKDACAGAATNKMLRNRFMNTPSR
jgi:hypothetical protein